MHLFHYRALCIVMLTVLPDTAPAGQPPSILLELFTSQGCSSCPPADALLSQLAARRPDILALSFHVDYWDGLGWKDPYSLPASTERQHEYALAFNSRQVFTPQLIAGGRYSAIGSNSEKVYAALDQARSAPPAAHVTIEQHGSSWVAVVTAEPSAPENTSGDVWLVSYAPYGKHAVSAGENAGRSLESINNVTAITRLGSWAGNAARFGLPPASGEGQRRVVLVQARGSGGILGFGLVDRVPGS